MTKTILQKNLQSLGVAHPDIARRVPRGQPPPDVVLASSAETEPPPSSSLTEPQPLIVVLGCSRAIQAIWNDVRPLNGSLFVVEKDPWVFHCFLASEPMENLLGARECRWAVGLSEDDAVRAFQEIPATTGPTVLILRSTNNETELRYYTRIQRQLEPLILHREANRQFTLEQRGLTEMNLIRNLPTIAKSRPVGRFSDALRDTPAFIIGAGPSLDRNIDQLRKVEKGLLLAVDTALGPLLRSGITPHAVITVDPRDLVFEHFREISSLGPTTLVFAPSSNPKILRQYSDHPRLISLNPGDLPLLERMRGCLDMGDSVPRGYMVGHHAFNVARYLGCSPLVLVGMDLAFPSEGKSHCDGAALVRSSTHTQSRITLGTCAAVPAEVCEAISVPGINEPEVLTTPVFLNYLLRLEAEIERMDAPVIDATEGGAYKRGTTTMSLGSTIGRYASGEKVAVCLEDMLSRAQPALTDSEGVKRELRRYAGAIERAGSIVRSLVEECRSGSTERCLLRLTSFLRDPTIEMIADSFVQYLRYQTAKLRVSNQVNTRGLSSLLKETLNTMRTFSSILNTALREFSQQEE